MMIYTDNIDDLNKSIITLLDNSKVKEIKTTLIGRKSSGLIFIAKIKTAFWRLKQPRMIKIPLT